MYAAPNDGVRAASPVAAVADVHRGALMWQEYACRRYTTADGLPSVLNERVLQDSKGYIWICGTSGLSRFDGFSFKTFLEGSFANLYSIGETESGAVYAISDRFIYVYDSAEDTLKRVSRFSKTGMTVFSSTLLPSGYCISYEKADDGDQSFCKITDNGIEKLFTHPDFREYPDANRAWYARAKNLLYLPLTNGISVFDGAEKVAFHEGINARCFVEYREALWAITGEAMYRLNADGNFELKVELNIGDNNEYMLARAGTDGTLLFSDYSTIYRYDGRKIEKIFSANIIKDFIVDRENNIWAVTYEGVYNLFDLQFRNLFLADRTDNVRSVVYDSLHNRVIMGTLNGKLLEVCEGKYAELPCPPNPLTPENRFMPNGAVIGDAVYMPSLGGFVKIRGGLCSWVSFPDRTYPFQFTVPFSDGAVLTGGYNYLLISTLNGKIVKTYSPENLKNRIYSRPCIDRHNRIWIGGGNGLNMIEGDSIEAFFDDSLAYCRVMTIDDDCNVWFASENRLYKISDADITKKYVFDNQITNIHFTKSGILVVSTLDKIHIFNKSLES
ncbi:MAG: hypothetical protein LBR06_05930, partial [Bacteroidales bacterium]|nr:hypothetical protein [Bacteroidales bacterium]